MTLVKPSPSMPTLHNDDNHFLISHIVRYAGRRHYSYDMIFLFIFKVRVHCVGSEKKWSATLRGIRKDPEIVARSSWDRLPPKALKLNVLMFGFDSLSRNTFIRKLPKSYEYLTKVLHGDVLQGYEFLFVFIKYVFSQNW